MVFEQTEKELTEAEILNFENLINTKLPNDFISHYLLYNGGYPPFEKVEGVKHQFTINGFMPIKYGSLPIEKVIEDYKKSGIFFENKIPFAYDNGGNIYLMASEQTDYGKVYIAEVEFLNDENHEHLVSNSFSEFLAGFYNED